MTTAPTNLQQWAMGYLAYIGAPAKSANDARVKFLEQWANEEGTYSIGNANNPLDIEQPTGSSASSNSWAASLPTSGLWNAQGVATYPDYSTGYAVTQHTMEQGFDLPIYNELQNPNATESSLQTALAKSNWTGAGQGAPANASYASSVTGVASSNPSANQSVNSQGTSSSGSQGPTYTLTGLAGLLQDIDKLLNPAGPGVGTVTSLLTLGTADVASSVVGVLETLVVRLMFAAGFMAITYLGVKTLTGTGGQGVVTILQKQAGLNLASRNLEAGEANRQHEIAVQQARAEAYERQQAAKTRTAQKSEAAKRATFRVRGY